MSVIQQNLEKLEKGEILTPFEAQIIDLIKKTCESFLPDKNVVARIAGGWVRDKLSGSQSDDIDFSIEGIDGLSFANQIEKVASKKDFPELVVMANPEQSAHIGSAKVYLTPEFYIDICGLRWDEYSETSRIPIITVGTPQQDALRRDVTVNAIFFNVITSKVEDFCNGIPDLESKLLRTCQPSKQSFLDDPLRILRIFRFGSRFSFNLTDDIIESAKNAKSEYIEKITAERANLEITKALEGPNPVQYVSWIVESELFETIFDPQNKWGLDTKACIDRMSISLKGCKEEKLVVSLAAIFEPLYHMEKVKDTVRKNNMITALEFAILREMKYQIEIAAAVLKLLKGNEIVKSLISQPLTRLQVGHFVMETGPLWPLVQHALYDQREIIFFIKDLKQYIIQENLGEAYSIRPLMRGNELAKLHGQKPGPGMANLIRQLIDWQLENPNGTKEQYTELITKCAN